MCSELDRIESKYDNEKDPTKKQEFHKEYRDLKKKIDKFRDQHED